jgi:NADH-quinone oxidoreductase subunit N
MLFFFIAAKTLKTSNTISRLRPLIKVSIILILLSLAGLPPFSGFFPKLIALTQLFMSNNYLALTLIIGSLITLYFYLNVVLVYSMEARKTTLKEPTSGYIICLTSRLISLIILPILILYAMTFFN